MVLATQVVKLSVPDSRHLVSMLGAQDIADADLVAQCRAPDTAGAHRAFALIVTRYEGFLRRFLWYLCRHAALADELAQDTFVTAWEKLATLREPEKLSAWLKRLAYRKYLNFQRHQRVIHAHAQSELAQEEMSADSLSLPLEIRAMLRPCSQSEQELLMLVYAFGFTTAEIAAERHVAEGTLKSQLHRAKQKIRASQAQVGGNDDRSRVR